MPLFFGCISRQEVQEDEEPLIVSDDESNSVLEVVASEQLEENERNQSTGEQATRMYDIFTRVEWNRFRYFGTVRSIQIRLFEEAADITAAGGSIPIERVEEWKEKEYKAEMAVIQAKYHARLLESGIGPRLIKQCKASHRRLKEALEKAEDEMIKEKISYWKAVFHDKIKKTPDASLHDSS